MIQEYNVFTQTIGKVINTPDLIINNEINLTKEIIKEKYFNSLEKIMNTYD